MAQRSLDWMEQARWDLEHGRNDLRQAFFDWACFSAQQAAEKACKAALQSFGAEAWGHAVADLLLAISQQVSVNQDLIDAALELDKGYIATRYPDAHPSGSPGRKYTKKEAERAIAHAEEIVRFCECVLSSSKPRRSDKQDS